MLANFHLSLILMSEIIFEQLDSPFKPLTSCKPKMLNFFCTSISLYPKLRSSGLKTYFEVETIRRETELPSWSIFFPVWWLVIPPFPVSSFLDLVEAESFTLLCPRPPMLDDSIVVNPSNFFRGLYSIFAKPGWVTSSSPSPHLVVELLSALKPDRDCFDSHLSQPNWGTKSFPFLSVVPTGLLSFSAAKPVRDWFVCHHS